MIEWILEKWKVLLDEFICIKKLVHLKSLENTKLFEEITVEKAFSK